MSRICNIIAGGSCGNELKNGITGFVIAADSGYHYCKKRNIVPDLIVGDFDSYNGELPSNVEIIHLPCKKDDTDLMYAVKCGIERGFTDFKIYGGYGTRPDQTYAMYGTLCYIVKSGENFTAEAVCDGFTVTFIENGEYRFQEQNPVTFSVFSFGEKATGVNISGAEYPLINATVENKFPIGVSNQSLPDTEIKISVQKGSLLIFKFNKTV